MVPEAVIDISRLSYTYPDGTPALDNISLKVFRQEKVAVIGSNGAGKSTLLLHLNGILRGNGSVSVNGRKIEKSTLKQVRRRVGFVFQNPEDQLFSQTVFEDVAFGPAQFGLSPEETGARVSEALHRVGLSGFEERSPFKMSFGEQKLVSLATALAMEPEILVLDEPGSNLDPRHRRNFVNFLKQYRQTLIIATHDLDFAAEVCPRTLLLYRGRIVADSPARDMLTDRSLLEKYDLELPLGSHF